MDSRTFFVENISLQEKVRTAHGFDLIDENGTATLYFFEVYLPILSSSWVLHNFLLIYHNINCNPYLFHTISAGTP